LNTPGLTRRSSKSFSSPQKKLLPGAISTTLRPPNVNPTGKPEYEIGNHPRSFREIAYIACAA
jgi:hypothetical protein